MKKIFINFDSIFNRIERNWESNLAKRIIGLLLILTYVVSLILIGLKSSGFIKKPLSGFIPDNYFYAINIAFTLLLFIEVINLVFGIARSVSATMGRQLEIFSLILLRNAFEELTEYTSHPGAAGIHDTILPLLSLAGGALFIFIALVLYKKIICHYQITINIKETQSFIIWKKIISLLLLIIYSGIGIHNIIIFFQTGYVAEFFETFYTVLIFADILIVLISMRYTHIYSLIFRNSAFALATITIRMALISPAYYNVAIGAGAAVFILGITIAYNKLMDTTCTIE